MHTKITAISILIAAVLIGGAIIFSRGQDSSNDTQQAVDNVSIVDGKQIITIKAKGSFSPKVTTAKAGMHTVLKFNTNGTFDCTSMVRIPSMNITKSLPPSGTTEIDLGTLTVATLQGTCGMGMYTFLVNFN